MNATKSTHTQYKRPEIHHLAYERSLASAFEELTCSDEMRTLLLSPQREVIVEIPIRRKKNFEVQVFKGYRVQHNSARGPYKGGLRYDADVELSHFKSLASVMTWKCALVNIPFGGGKGGINCDVADLSRVEREELTKKYIEKISPLIGPNRDIPAPDMGTGPSEMAWILEANAKQNGYTPAIVTGKPIELGGILGRQEATGVGVANTVEWKWRKSKTRSSANPTVIIQGFGKVGSVAAKELHERGFRITGLSEKEGGIYNPNGLDIEKIYKRKVESSEEEPVSLREMDPFSDQLTNSELLEQNCDILIPAATENAIREDNAGKIQATLIVEAANLPVSAKGEEILEDQKIDIIPDILANSGGVIVSFFEWCQSHQRSPWSYERVDRELKSVLGNTLKKVDDFKENSHSNKSYRDICYHISVDRVKKAIEMRGF